MEDLKKEFAEKNFDEKTLELIENFINEFDDLFGEYVSREEVIKRIKENLVSVEFSCEFEKEFKKGEYNSTRKTIKLAKIDSEEELKSIFFHEMIHCITTRGINSGFIRKFKTDDQKEIEIRIGIGLTEGFTQYVTNKRNKKYSPNLQVGGYPVLSEQVQNIVDLIGENTFLDIAFNKPDDLKEQLGFENLMESNAFYDAFDNIWKEENNICRMKQGKIAKVSRLIKKVFRDSSKKDESEKLNSAKRVIVETFKRVILKKNIKTVEELNLAYIQISKYYEQLGMEKTISMYNEWLEKVQASGISKEEIISGMNEEARALIIGTDIIKKFDKLSREQRLEEYSKESFQEYLYEVGIYECVFSDEILLAISNSIIKTDSISDGIMVQNALESGLAKIIKEKGYNINTTSLEFCVFDGMVCREVDTIINLYDSDTKRTKYLGSYCLEDFELRELKPVTNRDEILSRYPFLENMVVYMTEGGKIIAYSGQDGYIQIGDDESVIHTIKSKYIPSHEERMQEQLYDKLRLHVSKMQEILGMNAPEFMINNSIKLALKDVCRIKGLSIDSLIDPTNSKLIDPLSGEIIDSSNKTVVEELIKKLQEFANYVAHERREALEGAIGLEEQ